MFANETTWHSELNNPLFAVTAYVRKPTFCVYIHIYICTHTHTYISSNINFAYCHNMGE